jgi:uncharacterized protein YqjF (DUF2071 family)
VHKNPITMRGLLDRCWLFCYNTPWEEARSVLPPQLEPVTHRGKAFWGIVVSHIRAMRPWPAPWPLGLSYWHTAYRLHVRLQPEVGESVEGLYFVRSDCNSRLMSLVGNLLTDYNFHTAPIRVEQQSDGITVRIESPDYPAEARMSNQRPSRLPHGSVFSSLDEAAAFLKYKPYGISINKNGTANVVKIVREESLWQSRLLEIRSSQWSFFDGRTVSPEICYQVDPITYQWNRGNTVRVRA